MCVRVHACARVPGPPRLSAPIFLPLSPSHKQALFLPLCVHNHLPSLLECLMESGDGRKDEFICQRGASPRPSPPHFPCLLPCYSGGRFGKVFSPRRDRNFFRPPLPSAALRKGASATPCSVAAGFSQCRLSPGLPAVSRQLRQRGTYHWKMHNWTRRNASGWRVRGNAQGERAR